MQQSPKIKGLRDLQMEIEACSRCPYSSAREHPLSGGGEIRSPVLVLVPAVRQRDDKEAAVLSGRAGEKLDKLLKEAEIKPANVFKSPLVRCYGGRQPDYHEFAAFKRCRPHTVTLIKLMRPQAVVVCGLKALKWLLIRWTREVVDEDSFPRWIGQAVRLKDIWGDLKFFVIEDPAQLARQRDVVAEEKSIEGLKLMKSYVAGQQKIAPVVPLDMIDLKKRVYAKVEQQKFGWT